MFFILKDDSRKIKPGDTFIAIKSITDGHNYIKEAISNGATKIIAEKGSYSVETIIVKDTKEYLINYLDNLHKNKKNKKVIAVTGTNGKTTTAYLLYQALNKISTCSYIGTIGYYNNNKVKSLKNTTPGLIDMYHYIYDNESEYVVIEASSHAIDQHRLGNIKFLYIIFTNITQDHLDYHKTMDNYFYTKLKLIANLEEKGNIIVNYDDDYLKTIQHPKMIKIQKNLNLTDIKSNNNYQEFNFNNQKYKTYLLGLHNIYNLIPTIIILDKLNIKNIDQVIESLEAPPGRMEIIKVDTNKIIIDYAHTPDATAKIINATKDFAKGKIYVIIGCGGNRDKTKRPIMGEITTSLADYVIFTNDNPRDEDPLSILNDITKSLHKNNYEIEPNREKAIIKGIQKLKYNDILMVLGKGHENYQILKNETIYFDDKEIVIKNI